MKALRMHVAVEKLRLAKPFRISGFVFEVQDAVVVTLDDGVHRGHGEASGVYYLGDTADSMVAAIETRRSAIEGGINRAALQRLMPPGGARNAVDCALWDIEAQQTGREVWEIAGLPSVKPLVTTFTLGADDPAVMADGARAQLRAQWRTLFESFDAVICPIMPTPAFPHDHSVEQEQRRIVIDGREYPYPDQMAWPGIANLTGLPATAIPFGLSPEGLPIGVQIIGPWLEDRTALKLAELIEREFGGFVPPPAFDD